MSFAVLVCRLRQLQEEPRTVLPAPSVAGGRSSTATATTAQRDRSRQGGRQRRSVRGERASVAAVVAATAPATVLQSQRGDGRAAARRTGQTAAAAAGTVLPAQPERIDRRPGEGHIRDGQDGGKSGGVRDRGRSPATATAGHWPQHDDR